MQYIISFFDYFSNLGSAVMIPIVICIIGLVVGLKPLQAIRSGMTVGIGLIGINLVLELIWNNIDPINQILVEKLDVGLTTVDIGWAAAASLAFSTFIGACVIPFALLLNIILLATRLTRTMNIDIWNYWHYAFTGSCVYLLTDSMLLGFVAAATQLVLAVEFADIMGKRIQKTLGTPGITVTGGGGTEMVPVALVMDKIYSLLFAKRDKEKQEEKEEKMANSKLVSFLQTLVQPMFLGAIIGFLFGLGAGYSIGESLNVAMQLAALMFLLPRAAKILMEGFLPMGEQARDFMQKKFGKGRDIQVGLDCAILLGLPTTISVGLLLIPVTLLLAVILPNNSTLPLADLSAIGYMVTLATVVHTRNGKPNFLRTFITGVVMMCVVLPVSSMFAPYITQIAKSGALAIPENAVYVTCLEGNVFNGLVFGAFRITSIEIIGVIICVALAVGSIVLAKYLQKKETEAEEAA